MHKCQTNNLNNNGDEEDSSDNVTPLESTRSSKKIRVSRYASKSKLNHSKSVAGINKKLQ